MERAQRGGAPDSPFGSSGAPAPEDGGGGRKQDSSIPSDRELLEAMDPQAMWKDVQKHAGIGAHTQFTSHLS